MRKGSALPSPWKIWDPATSPTSSPLFAPRGDGEEWGFASRRCFAFNPVLGLIVVQKRVPVEIEISFYEVFCSSPIHTEPPSL